MFVGKYYSDERERQLVSRLDYIARYSGEYELGNVLVQHIKGGFYLNIVERTTEEMEDSSVRIYNGLKSGQSFKNL